jgi:hypothetical protein
MIRLSRVENPLDACLLHGCFVRVVSLVSTNQLIQTRVLRVVIAIERIRHGPKSHHTIDARSDIPGIEDLTVSAPDRCTSMEIRVRSDTGKKSQMASRGTAHKSETSPVCAEPLGVCPDKTNGSCHVAAGCGMFETGPLSELHCHDEESSSGESAAIILTTASIT